MWPPKSKGWIGERYDADAGLQYLNARYYDPVLGMFLQPDWFEVLKPGVGPNRFNYSFNDPVNKSDPLGNQTFGDAIAGFINGFFSGNPRGVSAAQTERNARTLGNAIGQSAVNGARNVGRAGLIATSFTVAGAARRAALYAAARAPSLYASALEMATVEATGMTAAGATTVATAPRVASGAAELLEDAAGGVYRLLDEAGNVMRNGRTGNLAQREIQHARAIETAGYNFQVMARTNEYAAQRGLEQHFMDLARGPLDRIRGIATTNPRIGEYMNAARSYLGLQ